MRMTEAYSKDFTGVVLRRFMNEVHLMRRLLMFLFDMSLGRGPAHLTSCTPGVHAPLSRRYPENKQQSKDNGARESTCVIHGGVRVQREENSSTKRVASKHPCERPLQRGSTVFKSTAKT
jgi:hypothetical protein